MPMTSRIALGIFCLVALPGCGADSAGACAGDAHDSDELSAKDLGEADSDWKESPPVSLDDCHTRQTLRFHGEDNGGIDIRWRRATVKTNTPNLHLCAYVACDVGATKIRKCEGDATTTEGGRSELGTEGCCTTTPGEISVAFSCEDSFWSVVSDDSAEVFVQVCPAKDIDPVDLRVQYHF